MESFREAIRASSAGGIQDPAEKREPEGPGSFQRGGIQGHSLGCFKGGDLLLDPGVAMGGLLGEKLNRVIAADPGDPL
jgi:hypothetical protein